MAVGRWEKKNVERIRMDVCNKADACRRPPLLRVVVGQQQKKRRMRKRREKDVHKGRKVFTGPDRAEKVSQNMGTIENIYGIRIEYAVGSYSYCIMGLLRVVSAVPRFFGVRPVGQFAMR